MEVIVNCCPGAKCWIGLNGAKVTVVGGRMGVGALVGGIGVTAGLSLGRAEVVGLIDGTIFSTGVVLGTVVIATVAAVGAHAAIDRLIKLNNRRSANRFTICLSHRLKNTFSEPAHYR